MEVEAKILLDEATEAALRAQLGAPVERREQRDTYLWVQDLPVALRVREDGDRAWVTLKSGFAKVDGIRMREEWEPAIRPEEAQTWLTIFDRLGMPVREAVHKHREVFHLPQVEVVIDRVTGLPPYVELEAKGVDGPEAVARLETAIAELGLQDRPRESASYRELLRRAQGLD